MQLTTVVHLIFIEQKQHMVFNQYGLLHTYSMFGFPYCTEKEYFSWLKTFLKRRKCLDASIFVMIIYNFNVKLDIYLHRGPSNGHYPM